MKTTMFVFLAALIFLLPDCKGQNQAFDDVFNKYALKDGFVTVDISGNLFNLIIGNDEDLKEIKIGNVKIISVEDKEKNPGFDFYKEVVPNLNMKDYNDLMHVKGSGDQLVILQKKKDKKPNEFLVISGGEDNFMLYIEGTLNLNDVKKISEDFDSDSNTLSTK